MGLIWFLCQDSLLDFLWSSDFSSVLSFVLRAQLGLVIWMESQYSETYRNFCWVWWFWAYLILYAQSLAASQQPLVNFIVNYTLNYWVFLNGKIVNWTFTLLSAQTTAWIRCQLKSLEEAKSKGKDIVRCNHAKQGAMLIWKMLCEQGESNAVPRVEEQGIWEWHLKEVTAELWQR